MRQGAIGLVAAAAALAGCAGIAEPEESNAPATPPVEGISYESGPCMGRCPVYRIAVNHDGTALFEGRYGSAFQGERSFRITPEEYRALERHLEPIRPSVDDISYSDAPLCESMATDMAGVEVRWYRPDGRHQRLYYYYGCDMERYRDMADRLRSVPALLGVAELVGPGGG